MLPVKTESEVLEHLMFVAESPAEAAQIGARAREWFDTYNGVALAKKWLALLVDPLGSALSHTTTPC